MRLHRDVLALCILLGLVALSVCAEETTSGGVEDAPGPGSGTDAVAKGQSPLVTSVKKTKTTKPKKKSTSGAGPAGGKGKAVPASASAAATPTAAEGAAVKKASGMNGATASAATKVDVPESTEGPVETAPEFAVVETLVPGATAPETEYIEADLPVLDTPAAETEAPEAAPEPVAEAAPTEAPSAVPEPPSSEAEAPTATGTAEPGEEEVLSGKELAGGMVGELKGDIQEEVAGYKDTVVKAVSEAMTKAKAKYVEHVKTIETERKKMLTDMMKKYEATLSDEEKGTGVMSEVLNEVMEKAEAPEEKSSDGLGDNFELPPLVNVEADKILATMPAVERMITKLTNVAAVTKKAMEAEEAIAMRASTEQAHPRTKAGGGAGHHSGGVVAPGRPSRNQADQPKVNPTESGDEHDRAGMVMNRLSQMSLQQQESFGRQLAEHDGRKAYDAPTKPALSKQAKKDAAATPGDAGEKPKKKKKSGAATVAKMQAALMERHKALNKHAPKGTIALPGLPVPSLVKRLVVPNFVYKMAAEPLKPTDAAFVVYVRAGQDEFALDQSLKSVVSNVAVGRQYQWVVFHEGGLAQGTRQLITATLGDQLFVQVAPLEIPVPRHFDLFLRHELDGFKFVWYIDLNTVFTVPVVADVFTEMHLGRYIYGAKARMAPLDSSLTTKVAQAVLDINIALKRKDLVAPKSACHPWGGVELISLEWFRRVAAVDSAMAAMTKFKEVIGRMTQSPELSGMWFRSFVIANFGYEAQVLNLWSVGIMYDGVCEFRSETHQRASIKHDLLLQKCQKLFKERLINPTCDNTRSLREALHVPPVEVNPTYVVEAVYVVILVLGASIVYVMQRSSLEQADKLK